MNSRNKKTILIFEIILQTHFCCDQMKVEYVLDCRQVQFHTSGFEQTEMNNKEIEMKSKLPFSSFLK